MESGQIRINYEIGDYVAWEWNHFAESVIRNFELSLKTFFFSFSGKNKLSCNHRIFMDEFLSRWTYNLYKNVWTFSHLVTFDAIKYRKEFYFFDLFFHNFFFHFLKCCRNINAIRLKDFRMARNWNAHQFNIAPRYKVASVIFQF